MNRKGIYVGYIYKSYDYEDEVEVNEELILTGYNGILKYYLIIGELNRVTYYRIFNSFLQYYYGIHYTLIGFIRNHNAEELWGVKRPEWNKPLYIKKNGLAKVEGRSKKIITYTYKKIFYVHALWGVYRPKWNNPGNYNSSPEVKISMNFWDYVYLFKLILSCIVDFININRSNRFRINRNRR